MKAHAYLHARGLREEVVLRAPWVLAQLWRTALRSAVLRHEQQFRLGKEREKRSVTFVTIPEGKVSAPVHASIDTVAATSKEKS